MSQPPPPAGWYADPSGQHAYRYWDGSRWTEQVQQAATAPGPAPGQPPPVRTGYIEERVRRQVREQAGVGPVTGGGGTLFTEPILVVNQKTKLIELTNEYAVFDQHGRQIGSVVEVGQSGLKKAMRFLSSYNQFFTHRLEVRDAGASRN